MPPNTTASRVKQSLITCCTATDIIICMFQFLCQIGITAWAVILYFNFVPNATNPSQCKMETMVYLLLSHGIVLACDSIVLVFCQLAKLCENIIRFRQRKPVSWIATIVHFLCSIASIGILLGLIIENYSRECETYVNSQILFVNCHIYIIITSIYSLINILLTCICSCGNSLIFSNLIYKLPLGNSHETKIGAEDERDYDKYRPVATYEQDNPVETKDSSSVWQTAKK